MCEPENDQWNVRNNKGKDGLLLLLSGQVDLRKQEVKTTTEQLRYKELEVVELQSTVQQLQSTIKGSDGSITLLKYQLAAARVGDSHNASMLLSQPSHSSGVHVSPDRQSLLLHLKRSRPVLNDILVRMKPFPVRHPIVASNNNTEGGDISSTSDDVINSSTVTPCTHNLPPATDDLAQRLVAQEQQNKQLEEQIVSWMAVMQDRIVGLEQEVVTKTTIPTSAEPLEKEPRISSEPIETSSSPSTNENDVQTVSSSTTAPLLLLFSSPIKEETIPAEDNHQPSIDIATIKQIKEKAVGSNASSSSPSPRVMQSLFNGLRQSSSIASAVKLADAGTPNTNSKSVISQLLPPSPTAPLSVPLSTLLNVDDDKKISRGKEQLFLSSSTTSPSPCSEQPPPPPQSQPQQCSANTTAAIDAAPSSSPSFQTVLMTPIKATAPIHVTGNSNGTGGNGRDALVVSTPGGSNITFSATMDRIRRIKQKAAEAQFSRDKNTVSSSVAINRFVVKVSGDDSSVADDRTIKSLQPASRSDVPPSQNTPPSKDLAVVPSEAGSGLRVTASNTGGAVPQTSTQRDKVEGIPVESTMRTNTPSKTLSRLLGGVVSPSPAVRSLGNTLVNNKESSHTKFTNGHRQDNDKENNAPAPSLLHQSQSQPHLHHRDGVAANTAAPLSPEQFSNEVVRLKRENGSIRDDILRFRGTLQRLREECQTSATAVINTGGQEKATIVGRSGGMGSKGLDTADDVTTVLPNSHHHQHHPPYYSRSYNGSREDAAAVLSSSSSYSNLPRAGFIASNGNNYHHHPVISSSNGATSASRIESFLLGATQRRPPLSTSSLASYPLHQPPVMTTTSSSSSSLSSSTSTRRYYDNNNNNNTIGNGNGSVSEQGEGSDLQYQPLQSFSTARRNVPLPPTHIIQQQPLKKQPLQYQQQQQQKGLYGMPPTHKTGSGSRLALSSNNSLTFADIDPTMIW